MFRTGVVTSYLGLWASFLICFSAQGQMKASKVDIKGEVPLKFSQTTLESTSQGTRSFIIKGTSEPGNIVMVRGGRTVLVPSSGKFRLVTEVPNSPHKLEIQAVSPKGDRSVYNFNLPKASSTEKQVQEQAEENKRIEEEKA